MNLAEGEELMSNSISNLLPFWHFDDDLMVFKDGSLGGGFKLQGFDLSCKTSDEINEFSKSVENIILSCKEGLKLQVFYKLTPNVQDLIKKHESISKNAKTVYDPIAKARINLLNYNLKEQSYFVPEIYFFVRSSPFKYKKQKFFEKEQNFKSLTRVDYQNHKEGFYRSLKAIESSLRLSKLSPKSLSPEDWFGVIFEYLNFDRVERIGSANLQKNTGFLTPSLNEQLALSDINVDKSGLRIGKYIFRVISLKTLPEGFSFPSMIKSFTSLNFHFWISQNIEILDQDKERAKLELQRRLANSMASGSKNVSDLESENKLANLEDLISELIEGSVKLSSSDLSVIIWARDDEELDEKCDEVLKAYQSLNQAEGLIETLPVRDAFFKALPSCCEGLRQKKMKSSNVAHLMALFSLWPGNNDPVTLLPNREGGLFSLDIFDQKNLANYNGICFGGSGAGKSFSINQLMLSFYGKTFPNGKQPRIIWIDNGASSKGIVENLDGEFLDFKVGSGICLNMFDLGGESKPGPEKIRLILTAVEMLLKDDDQRGLPKRHRALIEEAILKVYEDRPNPVLSDLKEGLVNHNVEEMRNYGETLFSWTGDTPYGQLLDGQNNIELSKDLVAFEIQSLDLHPELKNVFLLLLTSYIQDVSRQDFDRPYLLIVDEAERLFQTEMAKQFVITCYRTWRKFNSGIWCLSQNYKDFMQDESLKDSLMPNTSSVIILRQRKIDWDHFKKTFDFNDAQVDAIKSLEIVKGEYSEMFYLQDEKQIILRIVPEPLSYWICTTDASDKAKIREVQLNHPEMSKMQVLQKIAFNEEDKNSKMQRVV